MAKIYITEYQTAEVSVGGQVLQIALEPPVAEQVLDFTAGVQVSAAFNMGTSLIRVNVDAIASILISAAGTNATTTNQRWPADTVEYKGIQAGKGHKLSVISNT
jgi:hypothetical protein